MSIRKFIALEENSLSALEEAVAQLQQEEVKANELVSSEKDPEFQKLEEADLVGAAIQKDVIASVEASTALEAMAGALNKAMLDGDMSVHGIKFANIAIESLNASYGIKTTKLAISVEDYKQDPTRALKAAMEDIEVQSQSLWSSIKEKMVNMADSLVVKLSSFRKNIVRLELRMGQVEALVNKIDNGAQMRFTALKPQDWFIDLSYHGKAAPKGLVGIGPAVEKLLKESVTVMTSVVGKYNGWIKANHEKAMSDSAAFSSLKYATRDFLILNQKPFDDSRRVVFTKASEGCGFYRSEELPGGMALYTHLAKKDHSGFVAISCLSEVNYRLAQFDPVSYNLVKGVITTCIGAAFGVFVGAAVVAGFAYPLVAGTGAATKLAATASVAAGAYDTLSSAVEFGAVAGGFTGGISSFDKNSEGLRYGSKVKLTKEMVFQTLSLVEAKRVLAEIKRGIASMKAWETTVFKETYRDKEAADIIEKLLKRNTVKADGASVRLLKNLCFAIFNLQVSMSGKTLSYAIRTYNSMLNYVQKSSYQYR